MKSMKTVNIKAEFSFKELIEQACRTMGIDTPPPMNDVSFSISRKNRVDTGIHFQWEVQTDGTN